MESKSNIICFKCFRTFTDTNNFIRHMKCLHPFLHKYICKQNNCNRTFSFINGLKKHLLTIHSNYEISQKVNVEKRIQESSLLNLPKCQNISEDTTVNTSINEICVTNSFDNETFYTSKIIQDAITQFVWKMYNSSALPRNIVQIIVEDLKYLFHTIIDYTKLKLEKKNLFENMFKNLYALLKEIDDTFEMLGTEHKRLKFLENKKCYIKPQTLFIAENSVIQNRKRSHEANMINQKSTGQFIELRKILQHFLELPNVFDDIMSFIQREECSCDENVCTSILQGSL